MRTFLCCALLVTASNAGSLVRSTGSSRTHRADDGLGNYEFGYDEVHSTGGTFRRESGNAGGVKVGSYGLRDIDGRYRVVNYVADAAGFRAQVSTNEPGTAPSLTGAASYNAAPNAGPVVATRLAAGPIYGARVAPAVAPVPAFSAPTVAAYSAPTVAAYRAPTVTAYRAPAVYSVPARPLAAPIAFGTRVPVARVAYAAPPVAISTSAAAPITAYAAPLAPRVAVPVVPSYATRLAAPIATYSAPVVARAPVAYAAPLRTYAPVAAPVRAYAAPFYASPVYAYAQNSPLYAAPVANATAFQAPQSDIASMNSALPAALPAGSGNNAPRLFSEAAAAMMSSDAPLQSAPAPAASTPLSTAESNSTEVVAPQAAPQAPTFTYSTAANFFSAQRVNFSAPQFSFPAPAFDPLPAFPFDSARTAPVSDAPVTPVPLFSSAPVTTTTATPVSAPSASVANSTANTLPGAPAPFPFTYSFPGSDIATTQPPPSTPAPAVSSRAPIGPSPPFLSAVNAAFPAGTYAGPVVNETATEDRSTPAPTTTTPTPTTTGSPSGGAAFLSSRIPSGSDVPLHQQYTFSSQRLRAPIYAAAPVVAAAHPIVPQYALYAPVSHFTSSVHTRVDFAPASAPVSSTGRQNRNRQEAPAAAPEAPRAPLVPLVPQTEAPVPSPQTEAPTAAPTRAPEATTPQPSANDDDEDVADPRNAPPMLSARDEDFFSTTTTTQAAPTSVSSGSQETTVAPSTTEVPVAAEANGASEAQRSPASSADSGASGAALLSADRPVTATRVVARRRPALSVYASRVIRAPSAYRVFVPQYAHVRAAPVAHYAAAPVVIPKAGHVAYAAVPAVRYY